MAEKKINNEDQLVPKFFHAFHTVHSLFLYRNLDFIKNSIFIGVNRKWVWGANKRSHTGSDEEEGTRDPNVAPTDFTSREAKVINHQQFDEKANVFSFAIVLWKLVTAKVPYKNMTPLASLEEDAETLFSPSFISKRWG
ncbi:unnamed protein product [Lactuca saligna]|uniref:Serine-threonine/tyrosine-protein kinase catalytic domain-containing protein n=1 Tax=Lactuca saligna TaxID=75948 RepID=A0AA35Y6N1_LACSI|nr:unnamed protein product [Lactuca saligna]